MLSFDEKISAIVHALKDAGYDPYEQLQGYIISGNENYITRQGNARSLVMELDQEELRAYLRTVQNHV